MIATMIRKNTIRRFRVEVRRLGIGLGFSHILSQFSACGPMADAGVAMYAADTGDVARAAQDDVVHEVGVALQTIVLQDVRISLLDHDRLVKILKSKTLGVVIAVLRLGDPFIDAVVWQVAVDTFCGRVMAGFVPGIVLVVHDVAVDAGAGIGAEIREAACVSERDHANAHARSQQERNNCKQSFARQPTHCVFIG